METITLLTTDDRAEAEALRDRLHREGLAAVVKDETWLQRALLISKPHASEKVMVNQADYDKALELLMELRKKGEAPHTAVWCPQCGSPDVEFPQMTRKFITTSLAELMVAIGIFPEEYYCVKCHYTWAAKPDETAQRDILGWKMDSRIFHPENRKPAPGAPPP